MSERSVVSDLAAGLPAGDGFDLSPVQERLYATGSDGAAGHVRIAAVVTGHLDAARLEASWRNVIRRHELLRSVFKRAPGMALPVQVIRNDAGSGFAARKAGNGAPESLELLRQPERFDLVDGPVARLIVQQLSPDRHLIELSAPGLVADTASLGTLFGELFSDYAGQPVAGEPLQYADYSGWARSQATIAPEGDPPAALTLPWRRPDGSVVAFAAQPIVVPGASMLLDALRLVARREQRQVEDLVLAVWVGLLARLTGQRAVPIRVARDLRPDGEGNAVGAYTDSIVAGVSVPADATFARLTSELRDAVFAGRHAVGIRRMVAFDVASAPAIPGFTVETAIVSNQAEPFAWKLVFTPNARDHELVLWFDAGAFEPAHMERTVAYLRRLLGAAAEDFAQPLYRPSLLPESEARAVRTELTGAAHAGAGSSVFDLISAHAALGPDRPAIMASERSLSYRELVDASRRVAVRLREAGVGPGTFVGIFLDRSPEMATTILAILETGAAYVPVDPAYPPARQEYMLRNAGISLIVSTRALAESLPTVMAPVMNLDEPVRVTAVRPDSGAFGNHAHAAYVIFTSGSTGTPRGVVVTHDNISYYVQSMATALDVRGNDTYLHTASFGFSSSVRQLLLPLSMGAAVRIASEAERMDARLLLGVIRDSRATIADLVPSHWRSLVTVLQATARDERARLLDNELRLILSASEPLSWDIPATWRRELGHRAAMVNMFGQTETTGIVCTYPIESIPDSMRGFVPIGKPIPGASALVLDETGQLVPAGVAGELFVGGPGLGDGYLGDPVRTREKFVELPGPAGQLARYYRTGDQARLIAGNLEFAGRIDDQVKVRGFRVELSEVELALRESEHVLDVAVLADSSTGETILTGYVVVASGGPPVSALATELAARLPAYMVPATLVRIDRLPLGPHGKLDRNALRDFTPASTHVATPPADDVEQAIADVWADVLRLERVGRSQNFFAIGGHSLLAMVLVSRLRDGFRTEFAVRDLFEAATVAEQANLLRSRESAPGMVTRIAGILRQVRELTPEQAADQLSRKGV